MKTPFTVAALIFFLAASPLRADDSRAVRPADFSRGQDIAVPAANPIESFWLQPAAYQGLTREDLGDMRMFNAEGQLVPHAVRKPPARVEKETRGTKAPFYEINGRAGTSAQEVRIRMEQDAGGAILDIHSSLGEPGKDEKVHPVAYVISLKGIGDPVRAFEFQWKQPKENVIARIWISESEDLSTWRMLGTQTLAWLDQGGEKIERTRVEVSSAASFVRIAWKSGPPPFVITSVEAITTPEVRTVQEATLALWGYPSQSEDIPEGTTEFLFDTGGPFPVRRFDFQLPQPNTLVRAELLSAKESQGPWRTRKRGVLYQFAAGDESLSLPWDVGESRDRHWKLAVSNEGGGIGTGGIRANVNYRPDQILFVARGGGPFLLAYGSARIGPGAFTEAELLSTLSANSELRKSLQDATAAPGKDRTLSGAAALEKTTPPELIKTYALWALLILGVLVLAFIARAAVREMRESAGEG